MESTDMKSGPIELPAFSISVEDGVAIICEKECELAALI